MTALAIGTAFDEPVEAIMGVTGTLLRCAADVAGGDLRLSRKVGFSQLGGDVLVLTSSSGPAPEDTEFQK